MENISLDQAAAEVVRRRSENESGPLAESLEALASAAMKSADLVLAAKSLEEAGSLWFNLGDMNRAGSSLLLAASSHRLEGNLESARRVLEQGLAADLPDKLRDGFATEACEQALAKGEVEGAYQCFCDLLSHLKDTLEPLVAAQLYERRSAAALACGRAVQSANDLLHASTLYTANGASADGEAAALAAAAVLTDIDIEAAERIVSQIMTTTPADGGAAARRGLVAGRVALQAGKPELALKRFYVARQGALDCLDPITYLSAAIEESNAAVACGQAAIAYGRLATAWGTLTDLIGRDAAAELVRPGLATLRERIGADQFALAKEVYEAERRGMAHDAIPNTKTPTN